MTTQPAETGSASSGRPVLAWPLVGVVFAILWLFVRGVDLTLDVVVGQFLFGLAVGLPIAFVFRRLYAERVNVQQAGRAVPYAMLYIGAFGYELVRANLDVAYRVLAIDPPIEPEVILVPLRVRSAVGITLIANSITITPGTITLDHDAEENALYVHAIDGRDPEAIAAPIRTWEDYALEIFDEELSAADPAPEIVVDGPQANDTDRETGASNGTRDAEVRERSNDTREDASDRGDGDE